MTNNKTDLTLVLGGTGKTGSRVAARLTDLGRAVRIGSRSGVPPFDWDDRTTWGPALTGATAAYITYYPDLAFPGAADAIADLAHTAIEHDVRRLVLLSGRGEKGAQLSEQALMDSGADWTIVSCAFFAQNFDEGFMVESVLAGEFALPAGDVREPVLHIDDIADVAVAALTEPGHVGQVYELTGPRLMTFFEVAAELSEAAAYPVRADHAGRVRRAVEGGRAARRLRRRPGRGVHRDHGRPQRAPDRRRPAGARPAAARLQRLRAGNRGDRGVAPGLICQLDRWDLFLLLDSTIGSRKTGEQIPP
jgi:uncharacterized protein YbjT (DUF2867 family)